MIFDIGILKLFLQFILFRQRRLYPKIKKKERRIIQSTLRSIARTIYYIWREDSLLLV